MLGQARVSTKLAEVRFKLRRLTLQSFIDTGFGFLNPFLSGGLARFGCGAGFTGGAVGGFGFARGNIHVAVRCLGFCEGVGGAGAARFGGGQFSKETVAALDELIRPVFGGGERYLRGIFAALQGGHTRPSGFRAARPVFALSFNSG